MGGAYCLSISRMFLIDEDHILHMNRGSGTTTIVPNLRLLRQVVERRGQSRYNLPLGERTILLRLS